MYIVNALHCGHSVSTIGVQRYEVCLKFYYVWLEFIASAAYF